MPHRRRRQKRFRRGAKGGSVQGLRCGSAGRRCGMGMEQSLLEGVVFVVHDVKYRRMDTRMTRRPRVEHEEERRKWERNGAPILQKTEQTKLSSFSTIRHFAWDTNRETRYVYCAEVLWAARTETPSRTEFLKVVTLSFFGSPRSVPRARGSLPCRTILILYWLAVAVRAQK